MNWFAKIIFDRGGGNNLKKRAKSKSYLSKTLKITKFVSKKLEDFRSATSGSILIEFAVCMPVLIILLYYINDLSKLKRYYDQTEFVAQQMVNIIQNISQNRKGDEKKITTSDLKYAVTLAYQSIYPGTTMFWNKSGLPLVHVPHPIICYVKGNEDGTATTVWCKPFWTNESQCVSPIKMRHGTQTTSHDLSKIKMGTNVQPSQIYPTLKIKPGEVKIIVETFIFFNTSFTNVNGKSGYTSQKVFGLHLATPKRQHNNTLYNNEGRGAYFNSVQIFTPKSGLFDETPPK